VRALDEEESKNNSSSDGDFGDFILGSRSATYVSARYQSQLEKEIEKAFKKRSQTPSARQL